MRIVLLSPLPPYRGGIAQFGKMLLTGLEKEDCEVTAINYSHLYPNFLFPGKTQFEDGFSSADGLLHAYQPFSWKKTRESIDKMKPDIIISQWWHPFFAKCLSAVNPGHSKSVSICHNVFPHESFPLAGYLSRKFFRKQDLMVVHSEKAEIEAESTGKKVLRLFHPIYDQYKNTGLPREQARNKLGLKTGQKALLFFGLVRDYKGFDVLLKACDLLPEEYTIIAAGENYTNTNYQSSRLLWENSFIPDCDVGTWFNAADIVVLPYRKASQSGIAQIALAFNKPMVVTDTGGLAETVVPCKTGTIAAEATAESISKAILQCSSLMNSKITTTEIRKKASEFSWSSYVKKLIGAVQ